MPQGDAFVQLMSNLPGALQSFGREPALPTPTRFVDHDVPTPIVKASGMSPAAAQPGKVAAQNVEAGTYRLQATRSHHRCARIQRSTCGKANKALPALKEAFADLGYNPQAFKGAPAPECLRTRCRRRWTERRSGGASAGPDPWRRRGSRSAEEYSRAGRGFAEAGAEAVRRRSGNIQRHRFWREKSSISSSLAATTM